MSVEFAYQFRQHAPRTSFPELADVVLLADVVGDNGVEVSAGTIGTILSVHEAGQSYVVEFDEPDGAVATVVAHQICAARSDAR